LAKFSAGDYPATSTPLRRADLPGNPGTQPLPRFTQRACTQLGCEIPFNRHFYVFKPPRALAEIDVELKVVTDRIVQMIGVLLQ
jgi:hypothetical protein